MLATGSYNNFYHTRITAIQDKEIKGGRLATLRQKNLILGQADTG